jgi:hypothetical protein
MKKIFIPLAFLGILFTGCASQQPVAQSDMMYQEVVELDGKSQTEIYNSVLQALATMFNSSKAVIQYQDKDTGKIIGKGNVDVTYTIIPVTTCFTITIETKDNKMRVTFTDLYVNDSTLGTSPLTIQGQLDSFTAKAKEIVAALKNSIKTQSTAW